VEACPGSVGDFFKWAVREGRRPDNPVDRLPKLRPTPEPVYDLWKQEELDLLVAGTARWRARCASACAC
jgi:hypothetical protein